MISPLDSHDTSVLPGPVTSACDGINRALNLTGLPVDRHRHNRPGMHIQTNTPTLTKHRGLFPYVGTASTEPSLGNPRDCVSEPRPATTRKIKERSLGHTV